MYEPRLSAMEGRGRVLVLFNSGGVSRGVLGLAGFEWEFVF